MKTVRLDAPLEAQLKEAMELTGQTASQIIRDALETHCKTLVKRDLRHEWADVIGSVSIEDPQYADLSERTEEVFAEVMDEKTRAYSA